MSRTTKFITSMYFSVCTLSYINYNHDITQNTYNYLIHEQTRETKKGNYIIMNIISGCITASVVPAIFLYSPILEIINYKQYLSNTYTTNHSRHQSIEYHDRRQ